MRQRKAVRELFDFINSSMRYVVLRNADELMSSEFLSSEEDIDLLCENKSVLIKAIIQTNRPYYSCGGY